MAQCTAKSKRSGEQCKRHAAIGMSVCYYHGSRSLKGINSPKLKTGKYSKYLPDKLAMRYEEALQDKELLTLHSEISLIDTRLADILENIQEGDTKTLWVDLQSTWEKYRNSPNDERKNNELNNLEELIEKGSKVYHQWNEIYLVLEQRRKLVESENKRYRDLQLVITSDRAMLLITTLLGIIKTHVTDRPTLNAIATEFRDITNR